MDDIRFGGKIDYKIDDLGYISVSRNNNYTFEFKNGKNFFSLIYVESGELEYNFNKSGKALKIEKGSVLFIPKSLPYKTKYLKDNTTIKILIFNITETPVPDYLSVPIYKKNHDISSVFSSITNENMLNPLFLSAKIYELTYLLQKDNAKIARKYKKILPAINEISSNFFANEKISFYSDMCNMSESNFRKLFKEYTGKSPIEYRNLIRISQAQKMIDSGEFNVSEAAYLTGFNNMSFFYDIYNKTANKQIQ